MKRRVFARRARHSGLPVCRDAGRAGSPATALPIRSANRAQSGFTLIELLVVVVIVGVLAVALTLAVGSNGERQLVNESDRFQALVAQLCNQAELGGREYGVVVAADGYAFRRLDGTEWHEATTGELRARHWTSGLRLELAREGRPVALATPKHDTPQLVCFSSGELTPFALTLALGDPPLRYRVTGTDDGTLRTARLDAP
ncbi:MAG TPA: type II secretion system minor pseudopilin GspH [Dokdonella sp.]